MLLYFKFIFLFITFKMIYWVLIFSSMRIQSSPFGLTTGSKRESAYSPITAHKEKTADDEASAAVEGTTEGLQRAQKVYDVLSLAR